MKYEIRQTLPSKWVIHQHGYVRTYTVNIYADGTLSSKQLVSANEHISGSEAEGIVSEHYAGDWLIKADYYIDHNQIYSPLL